MKTLDQTFDTMDIKVILTKLGASLLLYFSPISTLIHAVLALFFFDWLTGVWKSNVVKRKFASHRMRKTVSKLNAYLIAIITAHIVNDSLLGGNLHLPQIAAGYIGLTELRSIYENLAEITEEKAFKSIIKKIIEIVKSKYLKS